MKPKSVFFVRSGLPLLAFTLSFLAQPLHAASITWSNTGTDFNAGAGWVGGVAPGTADIATFTGTRATNPALSATASVKGLAFSNSTASGYTISANTLTLGIGGIDASAVTSGTNTISSSLTLASGAQTWTAGAGSTLALNTGTFSRSAGSTLNLQGAGTLSSSMSGIGNTNGIVGPWATVGSGNTIRFAALTAGNLVSFTTPTVNANWTTAMATATTNYDVTAASATTFGASSRTAYTVRYLGATDTLTLGNSGSGAQLVTNCLINAGTGTLNLATTSAVVAAGLAAGSTNGIILMAANADFNVTARVHNNGATASSLTLVGPGTTTLSGANDYTGGTFLNSGTVQIGNNTAFGTGTLTLNGGNIRATGADRTVANAVAINGSFTLGRGTTFSGGVTLNNDATITSANPDVLAAATSSFTGVISGSRSLTFAEGTNPTGTIVLSGTNTYSGSTLITGGPVQLNGTGSINGSTGITLNGATAKLIQTSSTASTPAISLQNGTLDGTGALGAVTVADNVSSIVTNGNGGTNPLTLSALAFGGDATVNVKYGSSAPIVVTGALSTTPASGQVVINLPGTLTNGLYDLISFGSLSGSLTDFTIGTAGLGPRQNAIPQLHGNNIAVNVSGENIVWSGAGDNFWTTATTGDETGPNNWARKTVHTATNFWAGDTVEFNDTYDLGGGAVAVTQSQVSITTALSAASTTFNNSSINYEISGLAITGGSLAKSGTGTVTLLNANTYTGATTLNQGKLQLGNGTTNGSIAGTSSVINNATLEYNLGAAQTAAYAITGSGSVTKKGFGALTLTGANTYSGGTVIDEGLLVAGSTGMNGGPITVNSSGTLTFTGNGLVSTSTVTGAGLILNNTANTIVLTGDHTGFTGNFVHNAAANNTQFNSATSASQNASYALTSGELIFAANGDYTVKFGSLSSAAGNIRGGNTATGTATVEVGNLGFDSNMVGNFNNGATKILSLKKVGSGTLTLIGGANYTGATIVNSGTLAFTTNPKTLGSSAFTVADSAALSVKSAAVGTTMLPTGSLTLGASTLNFDFSLLSPTVTQISTGALTLNGALSVNLLNSLALGTGTYKLIDYTTLSGAGSLPSGTFSIGNRATATIVNNTVDTSIDLNVINDTPKWTGLDSGQWLAGTTGANSNWKLGVSGTVTDYLDDDQVLFDDSATGTRNVVIDSQNVFPANTTFNTATSTYTLSGTSGIAGAGSLTKSGSGSVILTNANTYTGATTINAGTLQLGDGTSNGSIASTASVTNNGTLAYNPAADQTAPYLVSGSGTLTKTGAGALTLTGANTYTGGTTLNSGVLNLTGNGTLGTGSIALGTGTTLNINKNLALTNTVTGTGAIVNTGSLTNTGDFSGFTGSFTHNATVVSVAFNSAITTSQNASYNIASDQGSSQGLIAGGNGDYTLKLGSLSGVANSLFRGGNTATGTTTLEIGNLGTSTQFAGLITNGATKTLALTKVGSGTLTLSGACNYSGSTLVNVGTLSVTGSLAAGSSVTVSSGAILKGTGTVAGTVAGSGIIAPGVGAGTLTTGAATLTGTLAIEIDGATGDKLLSTGAITLTGSTLTVSLLPGGFTQSSYVIAEGTSITGTFASVPSGYSVSIVSVGAVQQAVLTASGGYGSWASTHVGGDAANVDTDKDGVANGVEYFMNSAAGFTANPGIVSGAVSWPNGGNIPFGSYGNQFKVQTSTNLTDWTPVELGDSHLSNTTGSVTYTLPTGAGPLFVRLKVSPN